MNALSLSRFFFACSLSLKSPQGAVALTLSLFSSSHEEKSRVELLTVRRTGAVMRCFFFVNCVAFLFVSSSWGEECATESAAKRRAESE